MKLKPSIIAASVAAAALVAAGGAYAVNAGSGSVASVVVPADVSGGNYGTYSGRAGTKCTIFSTPVFTDTTFKPNGTVKNSPTLAVSTSVTVSAGSGPATGSRTAVVTATATDASTVTSSAAVAADGTHAYSLTLARGKTYNKITLSYAQTAGFTACAVDWTAAPLPVTPS